MHVIKGVLSHPVDINAGFSTVVKRCRGSNQLCTAAAPFWCVSVLLVPVVESLNHNMHGCFIRTGSAGRPISTVAAHGITWEKSLGAQKYFLLYTFLASCGRWATPLKSTVLHLGRPGLGDSTNKDVNVNREKHSWRKNVWLSLALQLWR